MQRFISGTGRFTFKSVFGRQKIDLEGICTSGRRKLKRAGTLSVGLMTTYGRVKPETAGPVTDTYLRLKIICLFYFVLESEKITIMSGLQWYLKTILFSPFLFFLFYFNSNCNIYPAVH